MTCKNCGKEFEGGTFCPHCGASQVSASNTTRADDAPSTGYAVLGFFFPLIGLILYLVWKAERPLRAKSCGKGALIGFIVGIIFSVISNLLIIPMIMQMSGMYGMLL